MLVLCCVAREQGPFPTVRAPAGGEHKLWDQQA